MDYRDQNESEWIVYTVEPLYYGHHWDSLTGQSVLIIEVSLFQSVHIRVVPPLYTLAVVQLIIIEIHIIIIIIIFQLLFV